MHICLVGPCSPSGLSDLLFGEDAAYAIEYDGFGGIPVIELARGLIESGHRVTVVTTPASRFTPGAVFRGPALQIVCVPQRGATRSIIDGYRRESRLMGAAIREAAPDIVHAHWTYEFALGALSSGLTVVVTAHDSPFTVLRYLRHPYRVGRLIVAFRVALKARHLSTVSPVLAQRWKRQMLFRRPVEVIPNSIPHDVLPLERRVSHTPTIISIGSPGRLKNIQSLLTAFKIVRSANPDVQMRLIGPGLNSGGRFHVSATKAGLDERVTFVGEVDRETLAKEYSSAWLMVHPSLEESFGLVLIEGVMSGIPVVGGIQSGAVPFVLGYGKAGTLVDVTEPKQMATAILECFIAGAPGLPNGAVAYIETNFSAGNVTAQYLAWYGKVLEKP